MTNSIIKIILLIVLAISSYFKSSAQTCDENHTDNFERKWTEHQKKTIKKEFKFDASLKNNLFMVGNVTGKVEVLGYNGKTIKVEIEHLVSAINEKELQKGLNETKVKFYENDNKVYCYLDSPYFDFNEKNGEYRHNGTNNKKYTYRYEIHYTVKVPFKTNLDLNTINGGKIIVENVKATTIDVNHVSGSIYMNNITGTTNASTISGKIIANFSENPPNDSSFFSISGSLKTSFPKDLNATIDYDVFSGSFKSDFETKKGNHKYQKIIGNGKINIDYKTTSGSVYVNRN
jgi:hypothetical protein